MKLKLTPLYILSFLFLTFFVMELHEWAHTAAAALVGGGWGPRGFDHWGFESNATVSNGQRAVATLAGPLVNILLLWVGWGKMGNRDSLTDQSFGCSLVLACLPMAMLKAAVTGGGDVTIGLKLLFTSVDATHHHLIATCGLIIVIIACVPPLIRLFILLPSWLAKFVFFPIFLVLPSYLHHLIVHDLLNGWLTRFENDESLAYAWVIFWTAAIFGGWLFTRRKMENLLVDRELPL
ncbi:MAG TPA: hypothetical protein VKQ52_08900 [Puia sp.]|nr:hypothetical protein [Puia sp.]